MSENTSKRWVTGFEPWHLQALNLRHSDAVALSHVDREEDVQSKSTQKELLSQGFLKGKSSDALALCLSGLESDTLG